MESSLTGLLTSRINMGRTFTVRYILFLKKLATPTNFLSSFPNITVNMAD